MLPEHACRPLHHGPKWCPQQESNLRLRHVVSASRPLDDAGGHLVEPAGIKPTPRRCERRVPSTTPRPQNWWSRRESNPPYRHAMAACPQQHLDPARLWRAAGESNSSRQGFAVPPQHRLDAAQNWVDRPVTIRLLQGHNLACPPVHHGQHKPSGTPIGSRTRAADLRRVGAEAVGGRGLAGSPRFERGLRAS
jgi:hypothetical protein